MSSSLTGSTYWELSSVGLEHCPYKAGVEDSSSSVPTLACHAIELIVDKDLNLWRLAYNSSIPISERSWSYKIGLFVH